MAIGNPGAISLVLLVLLAHTMVTDNYILRAESLPICS